MSAAFDIAVVGRGLMGTAAARYLAQMGHHVALIGPSEPENRATHDGPFGSHHDAGRITRGLAEKADWSRLALRSMARYRDLEAVLGQDFYTPCGVMMAGPIAGPAADFTRAFLQAADDLGIVHLRLDDAELAARFPYMRFPAGTAAAWEAEGGWINPRLLRAAEERAMEQAGGVVVDGVAVAQDRGTVTLATGMTIPAGHVVIASGGYARTDGLLPARPDMNVMARTVLLAEIAPDDLPRFADMPTLISMPEDGRMDEDLYLLPPIQYPDGTYYLKIGGEPASPSLGTQEEMRAWFRSRGSGAAAAQLQRHLTAILPDLPVQSYHTDTCVISFTATGYPYIERLDDHLTILTGGNGAAAKSCDEIGRLGAMVATGQSLNAEGYETDFTAKFL